MIVVPKSRHKNNQLLRTQKTNPKIQHTQDWKK